MSVNLQFCSSIDYGVAVTKLCSETFHVAGGKQTAVKSRNAPVYLISPLIQGSGLGMLWDDCRILIVFLDPGSGYPIAADAVSLETS